MVSEIPLLFETDRARDFDATVFVDARDKERRRRLTELRGLGGEEAGRIMAAQMAPEVKRELADHVLTNDGTVDELEAASGQLLQELRAEAGVSRMRLDLHLHPAGSFDCLSDPEAVLETSLARGLDRIAMTDHNRLHVALRMAEAHPGLVIPGEEVKTAEGVDVIDLGAGERSRSEALATVTGPGEQILPNDTHGQVWRTQTVPWSEADPDTWLPGSYLVLCEDPERPGADCSLP